MQVLKPAIDIIKKQILTSNTTCEDAEHAARTEVLPVPPLVMCGKKNCV